METINIKMTLGEILEVFEHHLQGTLTFLTRDDGTIDTENPIFGLAQAAFISSEILKELKDEDDNDVDLDTTLEYELEVNTELLLKAKKEIMEDGSEE